MRGNRPRSGEPQPRGPAPGCHLGVLLKAPIPGRVKTRLGAVVGMDRAAALHRAFSQDVIGELSRLAAARLWIFFTPASEEGRCRVLVRRAGGSRRRPRFRPQAEGGLGSRLRAAFLAMRAGGGKGGGRGRRQGEPKMVLVGTDSPLLERRAILRALDLLDGADLVLGPARDGGYYLIALRAPRRELFAGIPWSTPRVLRATLERARRLGLTVRQLPRDRDVDTWEDLRALWRQLRSRRQRRRRIPGHTYRACQELFRARSGSDAQGPVNKGF